MDDDSGRTPARIDYAFRDIGRKLRLAAASRVTRSHRNDGPSPDET
jgi:hypothetical protein